MNRTARPRTILATLLLFRASAAYAQTPISTCGQTWSDEVVLVTDLDCTGTQNPAITLSEDAILDLAGHTVIGGASTGVSCIGSCTIVGSGGTITGAGLSGIAAPFDDVSVSGDTVSANGEHGIYVPYANLVVSDVIVSANTWRGIDGDPRGRITATDVTATGNGRAGIAGGASLNVSSCTAIGNGAGFVAERALTVTNCIASGNLVGAYSLRRLLVAGSTITGNQQAMFSPRVNAVDTTVSDNTRGGISARTLRGKGLTLGNNALDVAYCSQAPADCADIGSRRRPSLEAVACETSARYDDEGSLNNWGVCTDD